MKQIKSKQRVKEFAEVYTNDREIYAMLDLVKDESYRRESKFLEPAGNLRNIHHVSATTTVS